MSIDTYNAEFISLILVFINSLILLLYIYQNKFLRSKWIISVSVFLKLFILISSYYDLFPIMFTGADSIRFDTQALQIWRFPYLLEHKYGTLYQPFLGYLYLLIGPQKMMAQYVNVILSTFGLILFDYMLYRLNVLRKYAKICMAILALSPVTVILSSVLMRDALVTNFFLYSICFFVLYVQRKGLFNILFSFLFLMLASAFHSGVFPFVVGILFYILLDKRKNATVIKILSCLIVFIGIFAFSDVLFSKFSGLEKSESEILEQLHDARGGSAYLTGIQSDSIFVNLLFSPLKALYFLFSPMLWDVRHLGDIVMIILDSSLYYFLVYSIFKDGINRNEEYFQLKKTILIGVIFVLFAFANGTHNSGTAARHRNKILPAICLLYCFSQKKITNETKNFDNSSCV